MRMYPLLMALTVVAACGGKNDADEDGVDAPADCDDNNADIKPGAPEICDGIDNNCDGRVDEGVANTYYLDEDGDGSGGIDADPVSLCAEEDVVVEDGVSYARVGLDCDDGDASVYPEAPEDCTAVDRNCDGNPYGGATDPRDWFIDSDGDGYGNPDVSVNDCAGPIGYVDNGDDCDDTKIEINPDADEVCNDIDDDCDGTVDDNPVDLQIGYVDADGDGYGDPATEDMFCLGDGIVALGTDCDDTNDAVRPGTREVCDGGIDNDCDPTTDEAIEDGDFVYPDADGDGYGDENAGVWLCDTTGYLEDGDDCDDNDYTINPDAYELCDAADRDCDGDPVGDATDATIYYADADGDGLGADFDTEPSCYGAPKGYPLTVGGDCDDNDPYVTDFFWYVDGDGDGYGDDTVPQVAACVQPANTSTIAGDCNDAAATDYPGANELCDGGIDNDCDPLTDENLTAEWYEDADSDSFGDETDVYFGCDPGSSILINPTQTGGDCDDADPAYNPILTPVCINDHCSGGTVITGSEEWTTEVEHIVSCDLVVEGPDKPRITIEPGAVVTFTNGGSLTIGDRDAGSIDVQGTTDEVLFTSGEKFKQEGDWEGLTLGPECEDSTLDGLVVEYGGAGGSSGLVIDTAPNVDIVVARSTFFRNSGDGVTVESGLPLIYDSDFLANLNNGISIEADQGLSRQDRDGTNGPSFTGNYINLNGARPISIPGSHADEIDPVTTVLDDRTVGAGNAIPEIELVEGTMRSTGTWAVHTALGASPPDDLIPYYVAQGEEIVVEDGPNAVLTIADGVEVYFDEDAEITIGDSEEGALFINDNVLFSATDNLINNSLNWVGLTFGPFSSASIIDGLTIEYGGGNGRGNIEIDDSAPTILNTTTRLSDSSGIYVSGGNAAPLIQNSFLIDNDEDGMYVVSTSGIARDVLVPTFTGNTVTGNGFAPVRLPPNFVGELDANSTFAGNGERVSIWGGEVLESATWLKLDEDYQFTGTVNVDGPQDPELTIEPGVTIYMDRDITFQAGVNDDGALLINAPGDPVVMRSSDQAPGEGDWFGLYIGDNGPLFSQTSIDGLEIRHAGGSDVDEFGAAIELRPQGPCDSEGFQRNVELHNIVVLESSKMGIWADTSSNVSMSNWTITNPLVGYCVWFEDDLDVCEPQVNLFDEITCNALSLGKFPAGSTDVLDPTEPYPGTGVLIEQRSLHYTVDMRALQLPYIFLEEMDILDGATLTVEDGAELLFDTDAGLVVADNDDIGGLVSTGPSTLFAGLYGYWQGLDFGDLAVVTLADMTISGAGLQGDGAIINDGGVGSISDVNIVGTFGACDYYDDHIELDKLLGLVCEAGEDCIIPTNSGSICYP